MEDGRPCSLVPVFRQQGDVDNPDLVFRLPQVKPSGRIPVSENDPKGSIMVHLKVILMLGIKLLVDKGLFECLIPTCQLKLLFTGAAVNPFEKRQVTLFHRPVGNVHSR